MLELKAIVLAVILSLTPSKYDTETHEQRVARAEVTAEAIASASKNTTDAAILLALAWHESRFAQYVQEGCKDIPVLDLSNGKKDRAADCDRGFSRSAFQMKVLACPSGWQLPRGDRRAPAAFAKCAIRLYHYSARRCGGRSKYGPVAAGFSGYGGLRCDSPSSAQRAETVKRMQQKLWNEQAARRRQREVEAAP